MKKIISAFSFALTLVLVQPALANDQYFSVGYEAQSWDISDSADGLHLDAEFDVGFLTAKAGYKLAEGVFIEGKLGIGAGDDSSTYNNFVRTGDTLVTTLDPKFMLGAFAVFNKDINESFDLYAKAGLNILAYDVEAKYTYLGTTGSASSSETETKFAIGAGMNYFFNEQHGVNLELSVPSIGDLGDIGAFTIGYIFRMQFINLKAIKEKAASFLKVSGFFMLC